MFSSTTFICSRQLQFVMCCRKRLDSGKHHCRFCGRIVCSSCSAGRMLHPPVDKRTSGKKTIITRERACTKCVQGAQEKVLRRPRIPHHIFVIRLVLLCELCSRSIQLESTSAVLISVFDSCKL
jgi:hypothetical protein